MPLYEYACRDCHHEFEALVRGAEAPRCPACSSHQLERRLSVFSAHTQGGASTAAADVGPMGGCGRCGDPRGPGACSMN
jgi:putative FmdB family regulatory protein